MPIITVSSSEAGGPHTHPTTDIESVVIIDTDPRLSDSRTPTSHAHAPGDVTGTAVVTNDSRLSDARTPTAHGHAETEITNLVTDLAGKAPTHDHPYESANVNIQAHVTSAHNYEPANSNIQAHVVSAHAPSNAQKNSDITKAEIEAKLIGELTSHTHAGGSSSVGVFDDMQMSVLQADGTLNAALGVQTWAGTNGGAQDVFTLAANSTYLVRGKYFINTGATTHTTALAWALSGATVASFQYQTILWSAALNGIATVQSTVHVAGVASKVINATSTAVYTIIQFEGIMVTGTGGTVTPQIAFSANPTGTNLMKRGSFVSFSKLGADTFVKSGGWA